MRQAASSLRASLSRSTQRLEDEGEGDDFTTQYSNASVPPPPPGNPAGHHGAPRQSSLSRLGSAFRGRNNSGSGQTGPPPGPPGANQQFGTYGGAGPYGGDAGQGGGYGAPNYAASGYGSAQERYQVPEPAAAAPGGGSTPADRAAQERAEQEEMELA